MFEDFFDVVYLYVRPLIKWFLHRFTKLCELQRLCYGIEAGSKRVQKVERSLELSRCNQIKHLLLTINGIIEYPMNEVTFKEEVTNRAYNTILLVKKINPKIHSAFAKPFIASVEMIFSYRALYHQIEDLRTQPYDDENEEHENKLIELWNLLMQNEPLDARVTKQWQTIGFQGDDPKTDFRGMGILGLDNLLYFARTYTNTAKHLLSHSLHPKHGYTFAVVGINITSMAYRLFKLGKAKSHFYNIGTRLDLDHFHQLYCFLFVEFDRQWCAAKPKSIMDFSIIQSAFESDIMYALRSDKCCFKVNVKVENI